MYVVLERGKVRECNLLIYLLVVSRLLSVIEQGPTGANRGQPCWLLYVNLSFGSQAERGSYRQTEIKMIGWTGRKGGSFASTDLGY